VEFSYILTADRLAAAVDKISTDIERRAVAEFHVFGCLGIFYTFILTSVAN